MAAHFSIGILAHFSISIYIISAIFHLGITIFNISILIIVFVILMNQDYYFPLFGLFATAGKIFLLSEGGGEQSDKADPEKYARQRRGRFLRVICGSMPALAGLEPPVTFAENSVP